MTAYTMVAIPGWDDLLLNEAARSDCDRRLVELARQAVPDSLPRDSATPFRRELHRHLARLVDQARAAGASLLCLPTQRMGDLAVPASYTVSEWLDTEHRVSPQTMLGELARASDGTATRVEVDGQPGLREDRLEVADAVAEPLAARPARRITYTIHSPQRSYGWLVFTFTTLGDGDPAGELAAVLVQLFDAQLTTLRWLEE